MWLGCVVRVCLEYLVRGETAKHSFINYKISNNELLGLQSRLKNADLETVII